MSNEVDGEVFLHVYDADDNLIAQADGPALGGMLPVWMWRPGDYIHDIRSLDLPASAGPYTVQVGFYDKEGRFPAFMNGRRCLDDAAPVAKMNNDCKPSGHPYF